MGDNMNKQRVIVFPNLMERGAPNLDGLTDADLAAFATETRGISPRRAARRYFPAQRYGAVTAIKDLNNYAWNLITARACRKRGEIQTAIHYESICDRIYRGRLPQWARW